MCVVLEEVFAVVWDPKRPGNTFVKKKEKMRVCEQRNGAVVALLFRGLFQGHRPRVVTHTYYDAREERIDSCCYERALRGLWVSLICVIRHSPLETSRVILKKGGRLGVCLSPSQSKTHTLFTYSLIVSLSLVLSATAKSRQSHSPSHSLLRSENFIVNSCEIRKAAPWLFAHCKMCI